MHYTSMITITSAVPADIAKSLESNLQIFGLVVINDALYSDALSPKEVMQKNEPLRPDLKIWNLLLLGVADSINIDIILSPSGIFVRGILSFSVLAINVAVILKALNPPHGIAPTVSPLIYPAPRVWGTFDGIIVTLPWLGMLPVCRVMLFLFSQNTARSWYLFTIIGYIC